MHRGILLSGALAVVGGLLVQVFSLQVAASLSFLASTACLVWGTASLERRQLVALGIVGLVLGTLVLVSEKPSALLLGLYLLTFTIPLLYRVANGFMSRGVR